MDSIDFHKYLPITDEDTTFHLLFDLSEYTCAWQSLRHMPVCGFSSLCTGSIDWAHFVKQEFKVTLTPEDLELLTLDGFYQSENVEITAEDVLGRLVAKMRSAHNDKLPNFASLAHAKLSHSKIGDFWFSRLNARVQAAKLVEIPQHLTIPVTLDSLRMAYRIYLLAAVKDGSQYKERRLDLINSESRISASDEFVGTVKVQAPGVTGNVCLLTYLQKPGGVPEPLDCASYKIEQSELEITAKLACWDGKATIDIVGTSNKRPLVQAELEQARQLPVITQRPKPYAVAFVLDGSMVAEDFQKARDFVVSLVPALQAAPDSEFAAVIFGEYSSVVNGVKTVSDLEYVSSKTFLSATAIVEWLAAARPMTPILTNDVADALELGLQTARQLPWAVKTRFLITIGNSPPHPDPVDHTKYSLLVMPTNYLRKISWHKELASLKREAAEQNADIFLASVWVDPGDAENMIVGRTAQDIKYAADVWKGLTETARPMQLHQLDALRNFIVARSEQETVAVGNLYLPLLPENPRTGRIM